MYASPSPGFGAEDLASGFSCVFPGFKTRATGSTGDGADVAGAEGSWGPFSNLYVDFVYEGVKYTTFCES